MPQKTLSPQLESSESIEAEINLTKIKTRQGWVINEDSSGESWQYDPEKIKVYYQKRVFKVIVRFINIISPAISFVLSLWWDKIRGKSQQNEQCRAIQLKEILTQLGPAYIKIGQALSTRPDLVPPTYVEELTRLQDQLPAFSNNIAFRFIEEELGFPPEVIYSELSPNPIAAASLGQVYKGKLKTGETVAVKVQRPDLWQRITLDIYIMRTLASWAQQNIQRLRSDLIAITDELAARVFEEMNYVQEAENAEKFAQLYGHIEEIYVPKIYHQYTGRRVLTMEWISGTKLTHIRQIEAQGIDATHLVEVGVECSLRQLLEHGFFHADPHPGNLLAMADGRLAYLDFGMMSEIKPYQRYGLIEAVVHLVNRDFEALAKDYVKLEFLTPQTNLEPIVPALGGVFNNALGASVAELNFKSITDQMSAIMYEFPFKVPAYYALIIRSMVTLEGIAINIDPNFKVLSKAYPYIAKRLLVDPAQELRASLRDLLFKGGRFRWNRLANLLRNASNSQDYDFEILLDRAVEFLFSNRGALIREKLVDEISNTLDIYGRRTWFNFTTAVREQVGLAVKETPADLRDEAQTLEQIKSIVGILQNTPGFDPMKLVPLIPKIFTKPETQQMGQKISQRLAQKVAARLIRHFLVEEETSYDRPYSPNTQIDQHYSLPPATNLN